MARQTPPPFIDEADLNNSVADTQNIAAGIALPVYQEIRLNNTVLNTDSVKRYIAKAKKIALMPCSCRTKRGPCSHPVDTCLTLNDAADQFIGNGRAHQITAEEALRVVEDAHCAGLVPMAYTRTDTPDPRGVNFICNCCSCCCGPLGVTLKLGKQVHLLKSIATTTTDPSTCLSCGACVERCHFGARKMTNGKLQFDKDLCFGCGLCTTACPINAISLIQLL